MLYSGLEAVGKESTSKSVELLARLPGFEVIDLVGAKRELQYSFTNGI